MGRYTVDTVDSDYLINGKHYKYKHLGHVYVLESSDGTQVKIGRSRIPQTRLKDLRKAYNTSGREYVSPLQSNCVRLEWECHSVNKLSRLRGEWFKLDFESAVESVVAKLTEPDGVSSDLVHKIRVMEDRLMDERVDRFIVRWRQRLETQHRGGKEPGLLEKIAKACKPEESLSPAMQILVDNLTAGELLGVPLHLSQAEAVKETARLTGQDFGSLLLPGPAQDSARRGGGESL